MPIYPPRNTAAKKRQILECRIFEFLKFIDENSSEEEFLQKAEAVRIAMLNFVKAKIALNKSYKSDDENESIMRLKEKYIINIEKWNSFTLEEIKEFCLNNRKNDHIQRHHKHR